MSIELVVYLAAVGLGIGLLIWRLGRSAERPGTDVGNPWLAAGFSLHDELTLFVQAGMPPLAALQTATINPARYLGALDSLGTIAEGKIADLVLLDANPLDDIRNTRRIRAVIVNGCILTRAALDSLLATVRVGTH